jgi:hypothetical protein
MCDQSWLPGVTSSMLPSDVNPSCERLNIEGIYYVWLVAALKKKNGAGKKFTRSSSPFRERQRQ